MKPIVDSPANNQYYISVDGFDVFQSYHTIVATRVDGKVTLSDGYPYSRTTSKYLYDWLGMTRAEVHSAIKSGKIEVKEL